MASKWITKQARQKIYTRDNFTCLYCGNVCNPEAENNAQENASLDHVVPRIEIASTCKTDKEFNAACRNSKNIITACRKCNSTKSHRTVYEFCKMMEFDYGQVIERIGVAVQKAI